MLRDKDLKTFMMRFSFPQDGVLVKCTQAREHSSSLHLRTCNIFSNVVSAQRNGRVHEIRSEFFFYSPNHIFLLT
jgi:hypothetical protein